MREPQYSISPSLSAFIHKPAMETLPHREKPEASLAAGPGIRIFVASLRRKQKGGR